MNQGTRARTPRILFFADAQSVHTQRWVLAMAQRGHDCVVATRRPAEVPGAREVIAVNPGSDGAGWFKALPAVRRIAAQVAPDLVHGHYVTSYGFWAAACGRQPVVLTAWGSDILVTPRESLLMRALVGWTLRQAALITADSKDTLEEIARYGSRAPLHEVLWGADTERFQPAAQRPEGLRLVSLRSWEPNYNIDVLLQAFATLCAQRPNSHMHLALLGGGPQEHELRVLAEELGLRDTVDFIGRVDDAGMVRAMQSATVSVTVPTSDATSVSLLESLSCGLAVVASDLPANRQWVSPAGGLKVPVRDAQALLQALMRLHDDPRTVATMGAHNRSLALRLVSRQVQMDRMDQLYGGLLAQTRGSRGK